jgi:hypothetical protein
LRGSILRIRFVGQREPAHHRVTEARLQVPELALGERRHKRVGRSRYGQDLMHNAEATNNDNDVRSFDAQTVQCGDQSLRGDRGRAERTRNFITVPDLETGSLPASFDDTQSARRDIYADGLAQCLTPMLL